VFTLDGVTRTWAMVAVFVTLGDSVVVAFMYSH
jgi:hypothetical protein